MRVGELICYLSFLGKLKSHKIRLTFIPSYSPVARTVSHGIGTQEIFAEGMAKYMNEVIELIY